MADIAAMKTMRTAEALMAAANGLTKKTTTVATRAAAATVAVAVDLPACPVRRCAA